MRTVVYKNVCKKKTQDREDPLFVWHVDPRHLPRAARTGGATGKPRMINDRAMTEPPFVVPLIPLWRFQQAAKKLARAECTGRPEAIQKAYEDLFVLCYEKRMDLPVLLRDAEGHGRIQGQISRREF
jgi:hypothetical protein